MSLDQVVLAQEKHDHSTGTRGRTGVPHCDDELQYGNHRSLNGELSHTKLCRLVVVHPPSRRVVDREGSEYVLRAPGDADDECDGKHSCKAEAPRKVPRVSVMANHVGKREAPKSNQ